MRTLRPIDVAVLFCAIVAPAGPLRAENLPQSPTTQIRVSKNPPVITDWEYALAQSRKTGKPIVAIFQGRWSGSGRFKLYPQFQDYCKSIEDAWCATDVAEWRADNSISYGGPQPSVPFAFQATDLPAVLLWKPDEKTATQFNFPMTPDQFLSALKAL